MTPETSKPAPSPALSQTVWHDRYFWLAVVVVLGLRLFPNQQWITLPLSLFGTYVHELFHGLSSYLTGGQFDRMVVFSQGGGVAHTYTYSGVGAAIVAAGGLLGPAILGAVMLFFSRRFGITNILLGLIALLFAFTGLVWAEGSFTVLLSFGLSGLFGLMALIPYVNLTRFFTMFAAIQLCLENLLDFDYMFTDEFVRDGKQFSSDTSMIANTLGGAYWFWGGLIAALTVAIILFALLKSRPKISQDELSMR